MISLRISLADAGTPAKTTGRRVTFGNGHLEAFDSPHISLSVAHVSNYALVWVGEDHDPLQDQGLIEDRLTKYRTVTSQEGIAVAVIRDEAGGRVKLSRTAQGNCPIYIAAEADVLVVSWRFEEAVGVLTRVRPDVQACRLFLDHGQDQVRDMAVSGVKMLWPGEAATYDSNGLRLYEAERADILLPGTLADDGRATDELLRLIGEAMRLNLARSHQPLVEVSGGLDSSCVAVAASRLRDNVSSYGAIFSGSVGKQQRDRRRELVGILGLNDFEAPTDRWPPFASLQLDECTLTPYDDMYRMLSVTALRTHPIQNFDLAITGIGGDELTMENTFIRRTWEVAGNSCSSATVAATVRGDLFLRHGIWPVNPLVNQDVIDFCRALPRRLREGRLLNILLLARAGLSDGFLFPRYYEHCGNIIRHEATLFDFDAALEDSIIADFGIADPTALLHDAREASLHGFSYELIYKLWLFLKLEAVLRRYVS